MKLLLVHLLLISSLTSLCQESKIKSVVSNIPYDDYGYSGGKRLDSINVKYAQVNLEFTRPGNVCYVYKKPGGIMYFNYGQKWDKPNDLSVQYSDGTPLIFSALSISRALNFLDYNGWKLVNLHEDAEVVVIIVEKK